MASEEERAKIMAEYLAGKDDNNEEEEFDEEGEVEDDDEVDFPVLRGRLKLDEESRLVYLGFWCMRKQLEAKKNPETKFKLKSVDKIDWNLHKPPNEVPIQMNGFFLTDETDTVQPHRKIREKGVEIRFIKSRNIPKRYLVKGQGENDFGYFALSGVYNTGKKSNPKHLMQCNKQYGSNASREDDGDYDTDDGADAEELNGLEDEANMSIEELRKKYYGGGGDNNDDDSKPPPAKKPKVSQLPPPDDDDDDDCGF